MKTINIQGVNVKEVLLTPESETPLQVLYEVLDDAGNAVFVKRVAVKREDMPEAAANAINSLVERITNRLTNLEGI